MKNVIMKSTLRQRGRTLLLVILVGVAAFALVARVTEFVVVRGELARIMEFYRAVGILSPMRFDNFTTDHDVTRALDIIENNRHVVISDTRRFTSGVMDGLLNTTALPQENFFNPRLDGLDIGVLDHYFLGFITIRPRIVGVDAPVYVMQISPETLLTGDPQMLHVEDAVFTNAHGQTTRIISRYTMRLQMSAEEGARVRRGEWSPLAGLESGELALFRATPVFVTGLHDVLGHVQWYLQPVDEANGLFFVSASDEAELEATLDNLQDKLALTRENQSTVLVMDSYDMTLMPRFLDPRVARLLDTPRFYGGRLLTYEDYGQPIAVIPMQLAVRRGLHVGETLTLTLRDNPRPTWIDNPASGRFARGVENWWDNNPQGWWSMIDAAHENWRDFPTYTLELEIVGVYWFTPPVSTNFTSSEIFVPAGVIPADFIWEDAPQLTGMYSFVLDSPRSEGVFMYQTRTALTEMGFIASFLPTGFDALAASVEPIILSITVNLVVFAMAGLAVFILVIFLFIRNWRKSVAIARALGIPATTVMGQLFTPVFAFWMPAVAAGSVAAWFFALGQARATLSGLEVYDVHAGLALYWLVVYVAVIGVVISLGVAWGGYYTMRSPVLIQIQGGKQTEAKYADAGNVPTDISLKILTLKHLIIHARHARSVRKATIKFCLRQILRTPFKTGLVAVLSLILVFSLGLLHNLIVSNEAEVRRLWETTVIEATILADFTDGRTARTSSVISPAVWDAIVDSGFVGDAYLEAVALSGGNILMAVSHLSGFVAENTKTIADEQLGVLYEDMEITFLSGFDADSFVYRPGRPMPVVIRRAMAEAEEEEGTIPLGTSFPFLRGTARVIGIFDGGLKRAVNRFGADTPLFVMPMAAHRARFAVVCHTCGADLPSLRPPYITAQFTINPLRNREIGDLREEIGPLLADNTVGTGNVPLVLFMDDDVLHGVIFPMEQNLALWRILYPIAVVITFILAIGLSLLSMLPNAKNAAIMRALGKTKSNTLLTLCIGHLMVFMLGALAGLGVLLVIGAGGAAEPFLQALMYIVGGILGAIAGAVIITAKKPVELLQIRE